MAVMAGTVVLAATPARAAHRVRKAHRAPVRYAAHAPIYRAALLEDADTGKVLFDVNSEMEWPPASMAKMMLILVAEDQINAGRFSLNDPVRISERAAQTGGSRVGLREGDVHPLGELIKAAVIKSANDAAVAIAEKVAGSVEACVRMMNERAQNLGMVHTYYRTVDGLPPRPGHDADVTNAMDLATVGRALIHNTNVLQLTAQETALFDDGDAVLHNTNHLIGHFEGCDGLKTGFTYQAGFNLTATAKRGDMRLVAVVLGTPSNAERFRQAARLMQWGFDHFEKVALLRQGQPLPVHVQVESGPTIQPIAAGDVKLVVPKSELSDISLQYSVPETVNAPVVIGEPVGQVIVLDRSEVLTKVNALCPIPIGAQSLGATAENGAAAPVAPLQPASLSDSDHPQENR
jgi:D-alanyl-D-alanine carboxypeptidase (penicillin-binding protein 5/6)